MNELKLNLIAIKTERGFYISHDTKLETGYSSNYGKVFDFLFDGKQLEKTYHKNWGYMGNLPTKIEKKVGQSDINHRHELIDPTLKSGKFPNKIELVEFDIEIIAEIENFQFKRGFKFGVTGKDEQNITERDLQYQLLDRILFHPDLLQDKKCRLSGGDFYKIIRNHIKQNINLEYAEITSDYDFCLTVRKRIKLIENESCTVDVNLNSFSKMKRKPKYETHYRYTTIYKLAPKAYQNYPVCQGLEGKNWGYIERTIRHYLNEIMKKINEPLMGVIIDN